MRNNKSSFLQNLLSGEVETVLATEIVETVINPLTSVALIPIVATVTVPTQNALIVSINDIVPTLQNSDIVTETPKAKVKTVKPKVNYTPALIELLRFFEFKNLFDNGKVDATKNETLNLTSDYWHTFNKKSPFLQLSFSSLTNEALFIVKLTCKRLSSQLDELYGQKSIQRGLAFCDQILRFDASKTSFYCVASSLQYDVENFGKLYSYTEVLNFNIGQTLSELIAINEQFAKTVELLETVAPVETPVTTETLPTDSEAIF